MTQWLSVINAIPGISFKLKAKNPPKSNTHISYVFNSQASSNLLQNISIYYLLIFYFDFRGVSQEQSCAWYWVKCYYYIQIQLHVSLNHPLYFKVFIYVIISLMSLKNNLFQITNQHWMKNRYFCVQLLFLFKFFIYI